MASTTFEKSVALFEGNRGRINYNEEQALKDILHIKEAFEEIQIDDAEIQSIATNVQALLRTNTGYCFEKNDQGAYTAPAITIDTSGNVHSYTLPLFSPTKGTSYMIFPKKAHLRQLLQITRDDLPLNSAGEQEIYLHLAKFKDMESLLIVPDSYKCPALFRALELETINDTIALVSIRACDGNGLGRSRPQLCIGKFKFLFPGRAIERSPPKTPAENEHPDQRPAKRSRPLTKEALLDGFEEMFESVCRARDATFTPMARNKMYAVGLHLVRWMGWRLTEKVFVDNFAPFLQLHPNAAFSALGNYESAVVLVKALVETTQMQSEAIGTLNTAVTLATPVTLAT